MTGQGGRPRDLDWGDVFADAANDPTLDRPCEEGSSCTDDSCPLVHDTTEVQVALVPQCQFHPNPGDEHPAEYDFKTKYGPWGYGCREAWELNRAHPDLGTGKGQHLIPLKKEH